MLKLYEKKLKVALCISGQMRNYEQTYHNLYRFIIKPLSPDIFIHTWDNRGCSPVVTKRVESVLHYKQQTYNKYYFQQIDEDSIKKLYNPKKIVIEKFLESYKEEIENVKIPKWILDHYKEKTMGNVKDGNVWPSCHIHSYLPMFYKIMKANQLKTEQEKEQNFKYDLVIRFRTDLIVHKIPFDCFKKLNTLWCNINTGSPPVPGTNKSQVSDRFAFSNSNNMDIYCSVFDHLNEYWKDRGKNNPSFDSWEFPVGDRLLRLHLLNCKKDYNSFKPLAEIYRPPN
jgi:hypothetical protein